MYKVVVVKDEGMDCEEFKSFGSASEYAESNTEDKEVERIGIFRGSQQIADWKQAIPGKENWGWYVKTYRWIQKDLSFLDPLKLEKERNINA